MLSLAISSLGKQEGGWCRKIIWTFSPAMDPTPQRGVKGAGRGDSSGQYSGALGGSSSERIGSRNRTGDLKRDVLSDQPSLCGDSGGREHGWHLGGGSLLTVPAHARHSHRQVQANDRQSAGIERCCRLVRKPPPVCVLCCQPPPLRGWGGAHGTTHRTDTWNIELLTQCLRANSCASSYEWEHYWYGAPLTCINTAPVSMSPFLWWSYWHRTLGSKHPQSGTAGALQKHDRQMWQRFQQRQSRAVIVSMIISQYALD